MKNKFKKFWEEYRIGILVGIAIPVTVAWLLTPVLISHNEEEETPMESTSDKSIRAETFDYKGQQYILFSTGSRLGPSGFLHDPDCKKCK